MPGELAFYAKDVYPDMGFMTTSLMTAPEAEDQTALVDDGDIAEKKDVKQNPQSSKAIWIGVIAIIAIVIGMGGMR